MSETQTIHCEQLLDHPPARVWAALTEPELQARWWSAGDIRPVVGHRFTLDMAEWGHQQCEVIEVEPERRLSYRFAEGVLDTTVTWTLEPEGDGTRLTLDHSGFDLDTPMGKAAFDGMGGGWPKVLPRIDAALSR